MFVFPLHSGNNPNLAGVRASQSEIAGYEKHHNNNTNDVKNIVMSALLSFVRSNHPSIFELIYLIVFILLAVIRFWIPPSKSQKSIWS